MTGIRKMRVVVGLSHVALVALLGFCPAAAQDESDDPIVSMVVDLLREGDPDMRPLALGQVREEAPGEAATKKFAELLPELPADRQAELLEALGDRGDVAARPNVLAMLENEQEAVRAAALRALGALGDDTDVALLAEKAGGSSKLEAGAARESLIRLRGEKVNATIVTTMAEGTPGVRVGLLGVLAARNAKEAFPAVLECTKDAESTVRIAALEALRLLADETRTATIVDTLQATEGSTERRKAELVLLVVCSRGRAACAEAIIAGLAKADVPTRLVLLRALARAGGPNALAETVARLKDDDKAVQNQAVRMLAAWPDPAAVEHLLEVASSTESGRHRVLAIRGLVRLARPQGDRPADLKTLGKAMKLANRPEEKRLVLGALGDVPTAEALALVTPLLDDSALADEAGLAAALIAEKMEAGTNEYRGGKR